MHKILTNTSKLILGIITLFLTLNVQAMALKENEISSQMKIRIDRTTNLLQNKKISLDDKTDQIFETFDTIFDYSSMSRIALGKQWKKLSREQQNNFVQTFTLKLKQSYVDKLNLYTDEKVIVKKVEKIKINRIKLHTELVGQEEVYKIIYKFHKSKKQDEWLIYDVEMIGVSIMKTYRSQFKEYLLANSFDKLLSKLKTKQ